MDELVIPVSRGDAIGGLTVAVFGLVLVQSLITSWSRLRLTDKGFELNKRLYAWTDVEAFHDAGTHLRVDYTRNAQASWGVRASGALGKVGFYTAPAYIPTDALDTGGASLIDILSRWKQGDRSAGRPAELPPIDEVAACSGQQLQIRLKLSERIAAVLGTGTFFVVLAVGLPWAVLDADDPEPWLVIAVGAGWLAGHDGSVRVCVRQLSA